jgi:hypothetical protein
LQKAVDRHLLGLVKQPIILCEGNDDVTFIEVFARHFKISFESVQRCGTAGRCAASDIQDFVTDLIAVGDVRFLRDPDFRVETKAGLNSKNEFFWALPSIESYLFLYCCERHKKTEARGSPLSFLLETTPRAMEAQPRKERSNMGNKRKGRKEDAPNPSLQALFAMEYTNGFRSQNRDDNLLYLMYARWIAALQAAASPDPGTEEFLAVARVLHSHTWVREVMATTTTALTESVGADFVELCPSLCSELQELLLVRCSRDPTFSCLEKLKLTPSFAV